MFRYRRVWCVLATGAYFLQLFYSVSLSQYHQHPHWVDVLRYPSRAQECCRLPTSTISIGLQCLSVGAHVHFGLVQQATSHHSWLHHASTFFVHDTSMQFTACHKKNFTNFLCKARVTTSILYGGAA